MFAKKEFDNDTYCLAILADEKIATKNELNNFDTKCISLFSGSLSWTMILAAKKMIIKNKVTNFDTKYV